MLFLLRFWLVGAPCCCPNRAGPRTLGPIDAGRSLRCQPFPSMLTGPLNAGRSPQRWLVPLMLAGPLDAGWSPQRWPVPSTLPGPLDTATARALCCYFPCCQCYSFVVVYEYRYMYVHIAWVYSVQMYRVINNY